MAVGTRLVGFHNYVWHSRKFESRGLFDVLNTDCHQVLYRFLPVIINRLLYLESTLLLLVVIDMLGESFLKLDHLVAQGLMIMMMILIRWGIQLQFNE